MEIDPRTAVASDPARLHAALDRALATDADDGGAALAEAIGAVVELRTALDGAMVGLLAAFEASGAWAADGHRTPASWMVANHGVAGAAARSERRVALAASHRPHLAVAAAEGRLCAAKLRLLVDARRSPVEDLFDRDEQILVAEALELSVDQLKVRLVRWYWDALAESGRNHPEPDPGGSDRNSASVRGGFAGRGILDADLSPEGHVTVQAAIAEEIERWRRDGSLEGDSRTWNELMGDALVALVARGAAHPQRDPLRPLVIAVVDLDTLLARTGLSETERTARRAELLGAGPISDAAVAELASRAGISLLITDGRGAPLWLGRSRRLATAAQRAALLATDPDRCYWPGCDAPGHRCQVDHLTGWQQGGTTDIDNLGLICGHHNRLKHRAGFRARRQPGGGIAVQRPDGTPVTPTPLRR
jgi:hypothetical protein